MWEAFPIHSSIMMRSIPSYVCIPSHSQYIRDSYWWYNIALVVSGDPLWSSQSSPMSWGLLQQRKPVGNMAESYMYATFFYSSPIIFIFFPEHGSTTDMLYAKLKNYHSSRMTFNGKQIFTKLEFTMDFRWSSSIAMGPSCVIHLVIECDVGATGAIFWLSMCKVIFLITTNDNDIVVIQFSSLLLVIM